MSSVQEIEAAIVTLSPEEQEEIYSWLDERFAQAIDQRIEQDIKAGLLDERIAKALLDHEAGNTRAL